MIKKIEDFLKLRKFKKLEPESTGYDSKRIDRLIANGFKLEDNYLSKFNKKLNGFIKIKKEVLSQSDNRFVVYFEDIMLCKPYSLESAIEYVHSVNYGTKFYESLEKNTISYIEKIFEPYIGIPEQGDEETDEDLFNNYYSDLFDIFVDDYKVYSCTKINYLEYSNRLSSYRYLEGDKINSVSYFHNPPIENPKIGFIVSFQGKFIDHDEMNIMKNRILDIDPNLKCTISKFIHKDASKELPEEDDYRFSINVYFEFKDFKEISDYIKLKKL